MNYLEAFLELLKNKKASQDNKDNFIVMSLGEIAESFGRTDVFYKEPLPNEVAKWGGFGIDIRYAEPIFLKDIVAIIKKLKKEKCISFDQNLTNFKRGRNEKFVRKNEQQLLDEILKLRDRFGEIHVKIEKNFANYYSKVFRAKTRSTSYFPKNEFKSLKNNAGTKFKIVIDFQKGIYNEKYPKSIYEISGKRKSLVEYLCNNKSGHIRHLIAVTGQKNNLIMQEIRKINDIFQKFCKTNKHLIIHNMTGGGYMINRENLNIKVIKTFT